VVALLILVDVGGVEGGVDDRLARRHRLAEAGVGERAADPEDHVGRLQEVVGRAGQCQPRRAERQRVRLREGALAAEAGGHRRFEQFGQFAQGIPRLGVVDPLPGVDHRALRRDEDARHLGDRRRVGAAAGARHRAVAQFAGQFLRVDIGRDFHDRRARATVADAGEGAAHRVADRAGQVHLLDRLADVLEVQEGAEVRLHPRDGAAIARRQHHDRRRFAIRLRDTAEGVLGAWSVLHREDPDRLARGDAADRVGHVQADPLLAHDDRADVRLGGGLDDRIDRVADQELDPLALQHLRDRRRDIHGSLLRSSRVPTPRAAPRSSVAAIIHGPVG